MMSVVLIPAAVSVWGSYGALLLKGDALYVSEHTRIFQVVYGR